MNGFLETREDSMNEAQSLHAKGDIKAFHKKFANRSNGKE